MAETDGDREVVVMGKNEVTREAEVEVIAKNVMAAAVDEVTVVVTLEVVAPSTTVQVNRCAKRNY